MLNKRLINTGAEAAPAAFDPLQNFETVTYTGNGGTQKITGYIRKGAAFNGSSSYIDTNYTIPADSTMSFSVWFNTSSTSRQAIFADYNSAGSGASARAVFIIGSGASNDKFEVVIGDGSSFWNDFTTDASSYQDGNWHNIVVVYNGTSVKLYADGNTTPIADLTSSIAYGTAGSQSLVLGKGGDYSGIYFDGKIDQVRIFDKALSSGEVTTLYGETYASSTKSTTDIFNDGSAIALYELDEDAKESYFGQAFKGDGTARYVSTGVDNSDIEAFSFWFYFVSGTSVGRPLGSGARYSENLAVEVNTNGTISCQLQNLMLTTSSGALGSTGWKHIYYDTDRTLYINGSLVSGDDDTSSEGNSTAVIGALRPQYGYYNERIDDVRFYSETLTTTQIGYLANHDLSNLDSIPNLLAHFKLDGNILDETGTYTATSSNVVYSEGVYGGTPTNVNFLGMAFQPDLVWIKSRDNGNFEHALFDSVRGAGTSKVLSSNTTNAEGWTIAAPMTSFDSNGFTVEPRSDSNVNNLVNKSGEALVAWCWKAGGTAVSNTDGSITSSVSANTDAGFSIVKYTGNATNSTVGHGLSSAPELILYKNYSVTANWTVYSSTLTDSHYLKLNTTDAKISEDYNIFNGDPDASVLKIGSGNSINANNNNIIAYCFHSVDGYQKVGSYTGNGSTTGPTVTTGFEPRFIMLKRTDSTGSWRIMDSVRDTDVIIEKNLAANSSDSENDGTDRIQFTSTGFQLKTSNIAFNANNGTYIYLAIG